MRGFVRLAAAVFFVSGALTAGPLSVVSLNLAKAPDAAAIEREIRERPRLRDADIYLFQEVSQRRDGAPSVADELAARMKLSVAYSPAKPGVLDQGLAIMSRYPIEDRRVRTLKAYDLKFHSRTRLALAATIQTPDGPIRITNAHLDTRLNAEDRLQQLAPVIQDGARFVMPRIVGGDWNSNDFYWLANLIPVPWMRSQVKEIESYLMRAGYQTPVPNRWPTFDHLGMKLDWIYGFGMKPAAADLFPMRFSDHHAIWARFDI